MTLICTLCLRRGLWPIWLEALSSRFLGVLLIVEDNDIVVDVEELLLFVCSWRLFCLVELILLRLLVHSIVIAFGLQLLCQDWNTRAMVPNFT